MTNEILKIEKLYNPKAFLISFREPLSYDKDFIVEVWMCVRTETPETTEILLESIKKNKDKIKNRKNFIDYIKGFDKGIDSKIFFDGDWVNKTPKQSKEEKEEKRREERKRYSETYYTKHREEILKKARERSPEEKMIINKKQKEYNIKKLNKEHGYI